MSFDIKSSSTIHHDRVDGSVRALYAAGIALEPVARYDAYDAFAQAMSLANAFNHPLQGDIFVALERVA